MVGLWYGEVAKNWSIYIFLTGARLDNLMPYNIMGWQTLKRKCTCCSKEFCQECLEAAFLEDGMHTPLRGRSSGSAFCRNSQITKKKRPYRSWQELVKALFNTLIVFNVLAIISTTLLNWQFATDILSVYVNYVVSHLLTVWERERESGSMHTRNCVYLANTSCTSRQITFITSIARAFDESSSFVE